MKSSSFPRDFVWGAATASYQIEGAVHEGGRGASIWDTFSRFPGNVLNGDTGEIACDHYHRWREDLDLMASLGLRGYRFSIAWPRLFPNGRGPLNQPGLDFYDRLVDGLLERGIAPYVTLYHWDLPQALQDAGGWLNRDTASRFADYAAAVFRHLGNRVTHWMTHNEPWCSCMLGHYLGVHAPGFRDFRAALVAAHHMLLSHGLAVQALRQSAPPGRVGVALNLLPAYPKTETDADRTAARLSDGFTNRWYLDPLYKAAYPADSVEQFSRLVGPLDFVRPEDLTIIAEPTDFLGINYYKRRVVEASATKPLGMAVVERSPGVPVTDIGWEIGPDCLRDLLVRVTRDYAPREIYVTENGAAMNDQLEGGEVRDPKRVEFLRGHFRATAEAMELGAPVKGFFVWSLMDNYEWASGYSQRFGIVFVDYPTLRRVPKQSAHYLAQVIREDRVE